MCIRDSFRYATTTDGKETVAFIHFEGLLLKSKDRWQIMMENQKSVGTEAEWKALSPLTSPSSSTKRIKMFELISWLLAILATVRLTNNLFVQNAVSRTTLSSFWLLADGLSVVCLPILMFSGHQLGVLKWLFLALFAIFYFLRFVLYVIGLRNSPGQGRGSGTNGTADWSTRVSAFQISSINTRLTTLLGLIVLVESTLFCGYACQSVEAWLDRQKFKAF